MSVIVLPDRVAASDGRKILAKWGVIADRIAGDEELREAIRDVLLYEHFKHSSAPVLGLPSDVAHATACFGEGYQQGIATAADALTDARYIAARRGEIEDRISKEHETDDDRA